MVTFAQHLMGILFAKNQPKPFFYQKKPKPFESTHCRQKLIFLNELDWANITRKCITHGPLHYADATRLTGPCPNSFLTQSPLQGPEICFYLV